MSDNQKKRFLYEVQGRSYQCTDWQTFFQTSDYEEAEAHLIKYKRNKDGHFRITNRINRPE